MEKEVECIIMLKSVCAYGVDNNDAPAVPIYRAVLNPVQLLGFIPLFLDYNAIGRFTYQTSEKFHAVRLPSI